MSNACEIDTTESPSSRPIFNAVSPLPPGRREVDNLLDALMDARNDTQKQQLILQALAPYITNVMRRELRNSGDDITEVIYPQLGRMIRGYVAQGVSSSLRRADSRIAYVFSLRHLLLRLQSVLTGKSYKTLLLNAYNAPRVDEALLVRLRSGFVIERWRSDNAPAGRASNENLMGGLLSALNSLADEALSLENGSLRGLDLGSSRVYIRATGAFLVVIRCTGKPSARVEREIDRVLISIVEQYGSILSIISETNQIDVKDFLHKLSEVVNTVLFNEIIEKENTRPRQQLHALVGFAIIAALSVLSLQQLVVSALSNDDTIKFAKAETTQTPPSRDASHPASAKLPRDNLRISTQAKLMLEHYPEFEKLQAPSQTLSATVESLTASLQDSLIDIPALPQILDTTETELSQIKIGEFSLKHSISQLHRLVQAPALIDMLPKIGPNGMLTLSSREDEFEDITGLLGSHSADAVSTAVVTTSSGVLDSVNQTVSSGSLIDASGLSSSGDGRLSKALPLKPLGL